MERLQPLIGEWQTQAVLPGDADSREPAVGKATFEWALGGRYAVERSVAPDPFPDGLCVIGADADGGAFIQHYFDSRGVTRTYAMDLRDGTWTLSRTEADFSPLNFSQRFTGTFSDDGETIRGAWEKTGESGEYEPDFDLIYTRVG